MHRWSAIQENVNKFVECVSRIEGRRQSRASSQDKIMQGCTLFKSKDKQKNSFQFLHCWHLLRTEQKWIDRSSQIASQRGGRKNKRQTPIQVMVRLLQLLTTPDDTDVVCPDYDVSRRPMGRKREKAKQRKGGDTVYMEALDNLWAKKKEVDEKKELKKDERYKQTFALEQEWVKLEQVRVELETKNLEVKNKELELKRK